MKLLVKYAYENRDLRYPAGVVIEVSEAEARFLQNDAPGCFEPVIEELVKTIEQPPADKMVKRARRK